MHHFSVKLFFCYFFLWMDWTLVDTLSRCRSRGPAPVGSEHHSTCREPRRRHNEYTWRTTLTRLQRDQDRTYEYWTFEIQERKNTKEDLLFLLSWVDKILKIATKRKSWKKKVTLPILRWAITTATHWHRVAYCPLVEGCVLPLI